MFQFLKPLMIICVSLYLLQKGLEGVIEVAQQWMTETSHQHHLVIQNQLIDDIDSINQLPATAAGPVEVEEVEP